MGALRWQNDITKPPRGFAPTQHRVCVCLCVSVCVDVCTYSMFKCRYLMSDASYRWVIRLSGEGEKALEITTNDKRCSSSGGRAAKTAEDGGHFKL